MVQPKTSSERFSLTTFFIFLAALGLSYLMSCGIMDSLTVTYGFQSAWAPERTEPVALQHVGS